MMVNFIYGFVQFYGEFYLWFCSVLGLEVVPVMVECHLADKNNFFF
jgi:hypothetical protein